MEGDPVMKIIAVAAIALILLIVLRMLARWRGESRRRRYSDRRSRLIRYRGFGRD
jgi:hypothetical protein